MPANQSSATFYKLVRLGRRPHQDENNQYLSHAKKKGKDLEVARNYVTHMKTEKEGKQEVNLADAKEISMEAKATRTCFYVFVILSWKQQDREHGRSSCGGQDAFALPLELANPAKV